MVPDIKHKRLYRVWKGNNMFFCDGRCIFGPDATSLLLSILLIAGPTITFCYQINAKIQHYQRNHEESLIYNSHILFGFPVLLVTIITLLADLIFLLLTSSRDPGIIPRNAQSDLSDASDVNTPSLEWLNVKAPHLRLPKTKDVIVNGFVVKLKYCDTCLLYRPPRTSHCSVCNNCVQKFDHHCPWVGQCIGLRNYRFFLLFISTSTFLCIFIFTLSLVNILQERKNYGNSVIKLILGEIISVVLMLYTFLSVWFVGGLSVFHVYLIYTNQTTYENFRYRFDKNNNPFNYGVLGNFKEVFFSRIAPSMINFRALVLDEAIVNGFYTPYMGIDVISTSEKFDTEKDDKIPFPTTLQNFDYNSFIDDQKSSNKLEEMALGPLDLGNLQENDCQGLEENKQSCEGKDGTIVDHRLGVIKNETVIDAVAYEGSDSNAAVPANEHANVQVM